MGLDILLLLLALCGPRASVVRQSSSATVPSRWDETLTDPPRFLLPVNDGTNLPSTVLTRASPQHLYAEFQPDTGSTSATSSGQPTTTVKPGKTFEIKGVNDYLVTAPILLTAESEVIVSTYDNTMLTYVVTGKVASMMTTVDPGEVFTVGSGGNAVVISVDQGISFVDRYYTTTAMGTGAKAQWTAFEYEVEKGLSPAWPMETITPGQQVQLSDDYDGHIDYTPTGSEPTAGLATYTDLVSDGGTSFPFTYVLSAAPPPTDASTSPTALTGSSTLTSSTNTGTPTPSTDTIPTSTMILFTGVLTHPATQSVVTVTGTVTYTLEG